MDEFIALEIRKIRSQDKVVIIKTCLNQSHVNRIIVLCQKDADYLNILTCIIQQ